MEHLARGGVIRQFRQPLILAISVSQIAHEREPDVLEMNTDLVRAARVEDGLGERCAVKPFKQLVRGSGGAAHVFIDRHAFAM